MKKERTSVKHQHLKDFKGNLDKIKAICISHFKNTKIHKYKCDRGAQNEMAQMGQNLTNNKPKLSREGKGLEKKFKKPLYHFKLKLKKSNNVFGDKPNINMEIEPHM